MHNSKPTQGRTTRRRGGPRGGRGSRAAGLRGTGRSRGRRRGVRRQGQGQRGRGGGGSRAARNGPHARMTRRAAAEAGAAWSGGRWGQPGGRDGGG